MHFVGDGRLVHVSGVRSDDEIAERLAPYAEGDCLVAVDASLVVTNPTGNRARRGAAQRALRPTERPDHQDQQPS
jgi:predicted RNase H-like nuclease